MSKLWRSTIPFKQTARNLAGIAVGLLLAAPAFAQGGGNSPWENAVNVLDDGLHQHHRARALARCNRGGWSYFRLW